MTTEITTTTEVKSVFISGGNTALGREAARRLSSSGSSVIAAVDSSADADQLRAVGVLPAYPDLSRAGEIRSAMNAGVGEAGAVINLEPMRYNVPPFAPVQWEKVSDTLAISTNALVEAAKAAGAEYLIHASYAFADADVHADSNSLDVERFLAAITRAEGVVLNAGIPSVVLRFGYVYGADVEALTTTFDAIMAGRPVVSSRDHHALAGWIHVGDAAAAIASAVDLRPTAQTLTVVDDRPVSPATFLKTFMEAQGMSAPGNIPPFLGRALVGKYQYALLNAASHVDNAETKAALNWQPRFSSVKQGIEDVLLSWRAAIKA